MMILPLLRASEKFSETERMVSTRITNESDRNFILTILIQLVDCQKFILEPSIYVSLTAWIVKRL